MSVKKNRIKFFLNFSISIIPLLFIIVTIIERILHLDKYGMSNEGLFLMIILCSYQIVSFEMGINWERGWKNASDYDKQKHIYSEVIKTIILVAFSIFLVMLYYGSFGDIYGIKPLLDKIHWIPRSLLLIGVVGVMAESLDIKWLSKLGKWIDDLVDNEDE